MARKDKSERLGRILDLIEEHEVEKQEQLVEYLKADGFQATQATVSRDIRELKLKKKPGSGGRQIYANPDLPSTQHEAKYIRILQESFISMEMAMNLLVIKTVSGMAMAAAAALDACRFHEIVGCIAGDDTIFCAVRSVPETIQVKKKIEELL